MQDCPDAERLSQLLDELLDDAERDAVEVHLGECTACQAALSALPRVGDWKTLYRAESPSPRAAATDIWEDDTSIDPFSEKLDSDPPRLTNQPCHIPCELQHSPPPGFELLAELGRGGMGVVYKARQLALNRLVALKMLHDHAQAEPDRVTRFRVEASAAARLQHPHIVQVFDVGATDRGLYICSELMAGGTLAEDLAHQPQPPRRAAEIIAVLADAVQHAHACGIIHRDLKPANVLSTGGTWKITDFGLAKAIDSDQSLTRTGEIAGTPAYMAPEQTLGSHGVCGPTTDVHALGAMLYEMLVGHPPFQGATLLDTLQMIASQDPVPPRDLMPKLPRDLQVICLKCLEKHPAARYATAAQLAEDLRRFLRGETIVARPASAMVRVGKWTRRHPALAASLSVAAVALAALFAFGGIFLTKLEAKNRVIAGERDTIRGQQTDLEQRNAELLLAHDAVETKNRVILAQKSALAAEHTRTQAELDRTAWLAYSLRLALARQALAENDLVRSERELRQCDPGRRGWEHGYLLAKCRERLLHTLEFPSPRHFQSPRVRFGADGRSVLAVGRSMLKVWDREFGQTTFEHPHDFPVGPWAMVVTEDGNRIAAHLASETQTIEVLRFDDRGMSVARPIEVGDHGIGSLVLSRDGRRLAFRKSSHWKSPQSWSTFAIHDLPSRWANDNTAQSADEGAEAEGVASLPARPVTLSERRFDRRLANLCAFSPNASLLVTAATHPPSARQQPVSVRVWDATNGEQLAELKEHPAGYLKCLRFSADGRRLVTNADTEFLVWDAHTWKIENRVIADSLDVTAIVTAEVTPDDHLVVAAGSQLHEFDLATGKLRSEQRAHDNHIADVAVNGDGLRIASMGFDGTVRLWTREPPPPEEIGMAQPGSSTQWCVAQTKPLVALANRRAVEVYNVDRGELVSRLMLADSSWPHGVSFHRNDQWLLVQSADANAKKIAVWDWRSAECLYEIESSPAGDAACSPDGRWLAVASETNLHMVDMVRRQVRYSIASPADDSFRLLAFDRDGTFFTGRSNGGRNVLWKTDNGDQLMTNDKVYRFHFHPDGLHVLGTVLPDTQTGDPLIVRMWELSSLREVRAFESRSLWLPEFAISPDGRWLAAYSKSGERQAGKHDELVVWSTNAGEPVFRRSFPDTHLMAASFTPASDRLVTVTNPAGDHPAGTNLGGTVPGEISFWNLQPLDPLISLTMVSALPGGVAFSPDGAAMVVLSGNGKCRIWRSSSSAE